MITIDLNKMKSIAHTIRRNTRERLLQPHDVIVAKNIPNEVEAAEAARVSIREANAAVQVSLDAAETEEEVRTIVSEYLKSSFQA